MQIFIGDVGAIAGVLIYRPSLSANFFRKAHLIAVGYTLLGILIAVTLSLLMRRKNQQNAKYVAERVDEEKEDRLLVAKTQGDKSKDYCFQI